MDAEKLISWGSSATIIKRYGLEEHALWSARVGVCAQLALFTTHFIAVFVCGLFTVQVGNLHSCLAIFLCVCESQTVVDH